MSPRATRVSIALLSAALVLLVALVDTARSSPGPLSAVHGRDGDLAASNGCAACHGGWFTSMGEACLECHAAVATQIAEHQGFHGAVDADRAQRCAHCHSEHNGPGFSLVNPLSFSQAGTSGPEGFDHGFVGFAMDGAHLPLDCVECHANASEFVLLEGAQRFAGLDQDCKSCHEDAHDGRMKLECASCHGQSTWDELHAQGHERHLPLIGGHADLACNTCHDEEGPHALDLLGERRRRAEPRTCLDCHDSPHGEPFVAAAAELAASVPGRSCVVCHESEHVSFREPSIAVSPAQHAGSGFLLDAPHAEVRCADCHTATAEDFAARYPGRGADECASCHADPHGGQFDTEPFAAEGCLACHERLRFAPHTFGKEAHARTALPLTGAHLSTECADCHEVPAEGVPRVFHATPSECASCHADAHAGFFEPFATGLPAIEHGLCARCHDPDSFADLPAEGFEHETWTGFPIRAAHAESECASCHPAAEEEDETGRSFGRVAEHFGTFTGCVTCHRDPHGGRFDEPPLPAVVDERTDCARCHDESSFRSIVSSFDHGRWTGFVLAGAHGAECSACHAPLRSPDEVGRTASEAPGERCSDCHADPHAGQFRVNGAIDCERCHTDARASFLRFDHERDARFALGEMHADVDCAACHNAWEAPDGTSVVRYRPMPMECVDCHGVQEDVLVRRRRRDR